MTPNIRICNNIKGNIMTFRIKGLMALKRWNRNPTKEIPVVLEWFLDYFFDQFLMKGRIEKALEAREALIEFCTICEKMNRYEATVRTDNNFGSYSDRGCTTWRLKWEDFKEIINQRERVTKQDRIIGMLNSHTKNTDGSMTIYNTTIEKYGLYSQSYDGDVQYIMRIANKLGYRCKIRYKRLILIPRGV